MPKAGQPFNSACLRSEANRVSETEPSVYVVDDDVEVLKGLERLLAASGLSVFVFESPNAFLAHIDRSVRGCLVLDLSMPGLNGLELQRALAGRSNELPVIFLTGRGDIRSTVQAMKLGAVDFLTKPVDADELLAAIGRAFEQDRVRRDARETKAAVEARFAALTPREREVLVLVVAGRLNKQVAAELGMVEKTVKFHRGNIMKKVGVRSVAELVRLADRAGFKPVPPPRSDPSLWSKVQ